MRFAARGIGGPGDSSKTGAWRNEISSSSASASGSWRWWTRAGTRPICDFAPGAAPHDTAGVSSYKTTRTAGNAGMGGSGALSKDGFSALLGALGRAGRARWELSEDAGEG